MSTMFIGPFLPFSIHPGSGWTCCCCCCCCEVLRVEVAFDLSLLWWTHFHTSTHCCCCGGEGLRVDLVAFITVVVASIQVVCHVPFEHPINSDLLQHSPAPSDILISFLFYFTKSISDHLSPAFRTSLILTILRPFRGYCF